MKCLITGSENADRHHVRTRGSGGSDDDWNIIYLSRELHQEWHRIGGVRFCVKYPKALIFLRQKGWDIVDCFGVKKLKRTNPGHEKLT